MKKIVITLLLLFLGVFLGAGNAFAAIIDFTGPAFSAAQGASSFFTPMGGGITFNPGPDDQVNPPLLWWDNIDGFGVQYSYEQDEIEGAEYLKLTFSNPFVLDNIYITDLFNEHGYTEHGFYQLDNSPSVTFLAAAGQNLGETNGELTIDIGGVTVDSIKFTAPGLLSVNGELQHHEFAVQAVAGAPVPIPAAILLLGSGLVGLAGIRKKFKR